MSNNETVGTCLCTHTTEVHPTAECIEQAAALFAHIDAMADIDLAPAVEAAAKERAARTQGEDWDRLDGYARHMWRESVYREVNAAAPLIVAAARAK